MKERDEIADSSDNNGLIGVVVWRKAHVGSNTNSISPNSSSHNKHTSSSSSSMKRQHHLTSSRRHHEKDANVNMNAMSKGPSSSAYQNTKLPPAAAPPLPVDNGDDESDIPPGFGPSGGGDAKDDDDLPEFNFSGNINTAMSRPSSTTTAATLSHTHISRIAPFKGPSRPVEQMRQLVHKYGQTSSVDDSSTRSWLGNNASSVVGMGIKPWNDDEDDDDDDIPEWRPLAPSHPLPNHHGFRQPTLHTPYVNQHLVSTTIVNHPHHHQPLNPASNGGVGRWVQPAQVSPGNQPSGGGRQFFRLPIVQTGQHQDVSRSRGF